MTPADRIRVRRWADKTCASTLEFHIEGALRADNLPRATILADVLADRLARRASMTQSRKRKQRPVRMVTNWRPVVDAICASHGLHARDLATDTRARKVVEARQELWFRLSQRGVAFSEIGRRLGGFHHTTVMHGVRQWAARLEATNG